MQISARFHVYALLVLLSLGAAAHGLRADATSLVHDFSVPALNPATTERLMGFGRLWGFLKYHHPRLGYGDLDWDAAFVETVPQVLAATDRDSYASALAALLSRLEDPITRLMAFIKPYKGIRNIWVKETHSDIFHFDRFNLAKSCLSSASIWVYFIPHCVALTS